MPSDISLDNVGDDFEAVPVLPLTGEAAKIAPLPGVSGDLVADEDSDDAPGPVEDKEQIAPANLRDAFALLTAADSLPERTKAEKLVRDSRLAFARKHVAHLQQGLPTLPMDATMFAHAFQKQVASLNRERVLTLAREHREIADLLAERDLLDEENKNLKAELEKLRRK
ncbi:MAG: hypothetical protein QOD03_1274 [Verrucomicrobiota bacterium]|jgi:hypothetical protein